MCIRKNVGNINVIYTEAGEYQIILPMEMTGADFKIWKETNIKDLNETKKSMKSEMNERIKNKNE